MAKNVIALMSDCDGTICPDTASLLVSELGLEPDTFWADVNAEVEGGWDPPLAWLNRLINLSQTGAVPPLTQDLVSQVGEKVQLFPGVEDFLPRMRARLEENSDFRDADVIVEWYIISSGIEELLRAMPAAGQAKEIFGSRLDYDEEGRAVGVKASVTFTEKTKFVFAVNKGIASEELYRTPYRVNDAIDQSQRRVPFNRMIYLGDGPSDIPCFSMVKAQRGTAIGVIPPGDRDYRKPYELATGQRLTVGPYSADYGPASDLFRMLLQVVESIASQVVVERQLELRSSPRY